MTTESGLSKPAASLSDPLLWRAFQQPEITQAHGARVLSCSLTRCHGRNNQLGAQQLKVSIALAEDVGLVPSTYIMAQPPPPLVPGALGAFAKLFRHQTQI